MGTAYDHWVLEHVPPLRTGRVEDCLAHLREIAAGSEVSHQPPFRSAAAFSCLVAAAQLASEELKDRSVPMSLRCVAAQGCALWAIYTDWLSAPMESLREVLAWQPEGPSDRAELVVLLRLLARHDGYWAQLCSDLVDTLNRVGSEAGSADVADREGFTAVCRLMHGELVRQAAELPNEEE